MKRLVYSLVLLFVVFSGFAQTGASNSTLLKAGDTVPDFSFEIARNKYARISDYEGKLVLLNFFATWCAPCNAEFNHLQKEIWEKYKDNPSFALLAFGREHNWKEVNAFARQKQVTFSVLPDPDRKIFSIFAKAYIPRSILINENGKIIYASVGFNYTDFKKLKQILADKL